MDPAHPHSILNQTMISFVSYLPTLITAGEITNSMKNSNSMHTCKIRKHMREFGAGFFCSSFYLFMSTIGMVSMSIPMLHDAVFPLSPGRMASDSSVALVRCMQHPQNWSTHACNQHRDKYICNYLN